MIVALCGSCQEYEQRHADNVASVPYSVKRKLSIFSLTLFCVLFLIVLLSFPPLFDNTVRLLLCDHARLKHLVDSWFHTTDREDQCVFAFHEDAQKHCSVVCTFKSSFTRLSRTFKADTLD